MKTLTSLPRTLAFLACALLSLATSGYGQTADCWLNIPLNANDVTIKLAAPYALPPHNFSAAANPSLLFAQVTVGNPSVPAGNYLAWCVDSNDDIDSHTNIYPADIFSSCDPNLNT